MNKKICTLLLLGLVLTFVFSAVDATDCWEQAGDFLDGYDGENTKLSNTATVKDVMEFLEPLVEMVKFIGNMVFVLVTVVLGIKYIWGGVESKASVKDSMVTLVVAALVFYGWDVIATLINPQNLWQNTVADAAGVVYSTIIYICNFLAVGGLVYIGIRYMMAGAEGRASLKAKSVPVVLGLVMTFSTIRFLGFILSIFEVTNKTI